MKSIMWDYIRQERKVLQARLCDEDIPALAKEFAKTECKRILFVASGSSLNVANVVSGSMETYWNVSVITMTPFTFLHGKPSLQRPHQGDVVFATSQTGTSRGTLECIRQAKSWGYPVFTISATEDSPVAKEGDWFLNFGCGEEDSNAKTKGYSSNLVVLQRFIIETARITGSISSEEYEAFAMELKQSAESLPQLFDRTVKWVNTHQQFSNVKELLCIGYGTNMATASEASLKLLETMSIPSMMIDIEEFSHGHHRAVHPDSTVILLCSEDVGKEETKKTFAYLKTICDNVLIIDGSADPIKDDHCIPVPYLPYTASALPLVYVIQILSVALPELLGKDPNYPYHQEYTELIQTRV